MCLEKKNIESEKIMVYIVFFSIKKRDSINGHNGFYSEHWKKKWRWKWKRVRWRHHVTSECNLFWKCNLDCKSSNLDCQSCDLDRQTWRHADVMIIHQELIKQGMFHFFSDVDLPREMKKFPTNGSSAVLTPRLFQGKWEGSEGSTTNSSSAVLTPRLFQEKWEGSEGSTTNSLSAVLTPRIFQGKWGGSEGSTTNSLSAVVTCRGYEICRGNMACFSTNNLSAVAAWRAYDKIMPRKMRGFLPPRKHKRGSFCLSKKKLYSSTEIDQDSRSNTFTSLSSKIYQNSRSNTFTSLSTKIDQNSSSCLHTFSKNKASLSMKTVIHVFNKFSKNKMKIMRHYLIWYTVRMIMRHYLILSTLIQRIPVSKDFQNLQYWEHLLLQHCQHWRYQVQLGGHQLPHAKKLIM